MARVNKALSVAASSLPIRCDSQRHLGKNGSKPRLHAERPWPWRLQAAGGGIHIAYIHCQPAYPQRAEQRSDRSGRTLAIVCDI